MSTKGSVRRIRLKDVALQAGVSSMTASAALNGRRGVGAERSAEIRRIAETMGYQVNDAARLLKSKSIRDIGLVISETPETLRTNAGFSDLLVSFMRECVRRRVDYRVEWLDYAQADAPPPALFNNGLANSFIIAGGLRPTVLDYLEKKFRLPYVRLGEPGPHSVENDYAEGVRQAVCHLVTRGHRRIGFVNGGGFRVYDEAEEGFRRGAAECALSLPDEYCRQIFFHRTVGGYGTLAPETADWLVGLGRRRPTALVCVNGLFTKALVYELACRGLLVPRDLSLIVFMTIDWEMTHFSPELTAVEYAMSDLVVPALDLLEDLFAGREPRCRRLKVAPRLVERATVARIG